MALVAFLQVGARIQRKFRDTERFTQTETGGAPLPHMIARLQETGDSSSHPDVTT